MICDKPKDKYFYNAFGSFSYKYLEMFDLELTCTHYNTCMNKILIIDSLHIAFNQAGNCCLHMNTLNATNQ